MRPRVKWGAGEAINEPAHGDLLHPCAEQRDALSGEEEPVIFVSEGAGHKFEP